MTVGDDKQILIWDTSRDFLEEEEEVEGRTLPFVDRIPTKAVLMGVTHHRHEKRFATCGEAVILWDADTRSPVNQYQWGVDSVHCLRFNQVREGGIWTMAYTTFFFSGR